MKKRDILIAVGIFLVILVLLMPMKKCEIKDNYMDISNKNKRVAYKYTLTPEECKQINATSGSVKIEGVMVGYNDETKYAVVQPYIVDMYIDGSNNSRRATPSTVKNDIERKKIFELPTMPLIHTLVPIDILKPTDPSQKDLLEKEIANFKVTIPDINQGVRKVGSLVMYKYNKDKPDSALCADKGDMIYIYGIINSINSNNNTARIMPLSIEVKGPTTDKGGRCNSPSRRVVFTRFQDTNNLKNYKEWIDSYFGDASKTPVYDQLLVTDVPIGALLPVTSIPLI
jgi:hypothetical protein